MADQPGEPETKAGTMNAQWMPSLTDVDHTLPVLAHVVFWANPRVRQAEDTGLHLMGVLNFVDPNLRDNYI